MRNQKHDKDVLILYGLFVVLFAAFGISGYAQTTGNRVEEIRKEVANINSAKLKLEAIHYPYSNKCGVIKASIVIYHKKGEVRKIMDTGKGDDDKAASSWSYEYYYKNGQLIFSYQTRKYFNNETNKEDHEAIREYFVANRLIKQIENGKTAYPKNVFINNSDTRYRLKSIVRASDIDKLYECPGL